MGDIWDMDIGVDRDMIIRQCTEDREQVADDLFILRPELKGQPAALWIEDFLELCGVQVCDCPLPPGQLGLCNIEEKIIFVNSQMDEFVGVDDKVKLKALRASTISHELGHLRLHDGEDENIFYDSVHFAKGFFIHPRAYQREREADLYGALFLVPLKSLKEHKVSLKLCSSRESKRRLWSSTIWRGVYHLAKDFHVSPSLIKRYLTELGWIRDGDKAKSLKLKWEKKG